MESELLMMDDELIKKAGKLMIKSSYSAKKRVRTRQDYIDKGVTYELDTGRKLVEQIKRELPDKWIQWLEQTRNYLIHGKDDNKRPTIDRMDSDGNYCLENIDFLPYDIHIRKDRAVGVTVYDIHGQSFNQYVTMTEASKALMCSIETVSKYTGSDVLYKNRYLIQAEAGKSGKCSRKVERIQKVQVVATVIVNEYDDNGNITREFPVQMKGEISFPAIEVRRHVV